MKKESQLDIFLANKLEITSRAVKAMKADNHSRYQREMIGALVLSSGCDFKSVVDGFYSNSFPTVLNDSHKDVLKAVMSIASIGGDFHTPQNNPTIPRETVLFISDYLRFFYLGQSGENKEVLGFQFYHDHETGYQSILHVFSQTLMCGEFEYIDEIEIAVYDDKGSVKNMAEIINIISAKFPTIKKRDYKSSVFNLKSVVHYLSPEKVKSRLDDTNRTSHIVHLLDYHDVYYKDIRFRLTGNTGGMISCDVEVEYKGEVFPFSSEDADMETFIILGKKNMFKIYDLLEADPKSYERLSLAFDKLALVYEEDKRNEEEGVDCDAGASGFSNNVFYIFYDGIEVGLASALSSNIIKEEGKTWIIVAKEDAFDNYQSNIPENRENTFKVKSSECLYGGHNIATNEDN